MIFLFIVLVYITVGFAVYPFWNWLSNKCLSAEWQMNLDEKPLIYILGCLCVFIPIWPYALYTVFSLWIIKKLDKKNRSE